MLRPLAMERKCVPPSSVTRNVPPLPTAQPNCGLSLEKPTELRVAFAGPETCDQVAPLSAGRQMRPFAPPATPRGPESDERSTTPPSPTAQARERSEAKSTARSADPTREATAAHVEPPSPVRKSVPPSPTASPAAGSAKMRARREESVGVG